MVAPKFRDKKVLKLAADFMHQPQSNFGSYPKTDAVFRFVPYRFFSLLSLVETNRWVRTELRGACTKLEIHETQFSPKRIILSSGKSEKRFFKIEISLFIKLRLYRETSSCGMGVT